MADEIKDEKELEVLFEKASKMGALLALLHFDSYSREKDVVSAALVDLIGRISNEKGVLYCKGVVEEPVETSDEKGKGYSNYTEVKVLFANFDVALGVCLKFGPAAVEVLQPRELRMNREGMQNAMLNASSVAQYFTSYFMSKLLKKDDYDEYQENLKKRIEHGKELIEKAQKEPEKK